MDTQQHVPATSYGFIGLGVMGWGMANNLRAKLPHDASLYVCEIDKQRLQDWTYQASGPVSTAETPAEIIQKCDIIITMLPAGPHVRKVFTDPETGLLSIKPEKNKRGSRVFIDCSTIDVQTCKEVAAQVAASGLGVFADAPVSGGQGGASAGTLTFMVGSTSAVFSTIQPILRLMGNPDHIYHCGDAGAGLATKLINNYLSAVNMIGVCEGMNMGCRYGLDLPTLANVINNSTGMSRNSREQNPVKGISATASSAQGFEGGFSTELCHGVIKMSRELGTQLGTRSVLGESVEKFYGEAVENDKCKGKDYRSIYRIFTEEDGE